MEKIFNACDYMNKIFLFLLPDKLAQTTENTMSINKIHINNTTNLSLNDRFTVMQSVGPKLPAPTRKVAPRRRTQSASSILEKPSPNVSLANRKLLEQLDKKHKMRAALKLKRVNERSKSDETKIT